MHFNGPPIGGVPLRITVTFVFLATMAGAYSGRNVAEASITKVPPAPKDWRGLGAWLDAIDTTITHPSIGWAIVAGVGVTFVCFLSVLLHELGHLFAAKLAGARPVAIELHYTGGFVELEDTDRLTAGRLAAIFAAGPLVTAMLASASLMALRIVEVSLGETPKLESAAGVAFERVLTVALIMNSLMLVINLLPIRSLDGGQLLLAARLRIARGW